MITIYTDGATEGLNGKLGTVTHCGIGFYDSSTQYQHSERIEAISNNEAEFWALIKAMEYATLEGYKNVKFCLDSMIVVNRANGTRPKKKKYQNLRMDAFQDKVLSLKKNFDECDFVWIPREENLMADYLSKYSLNGTNKKN